MYSSLLKGRSLRSDKLRLAVNLSRVFFFFFLHETKLWTSLDSSKMNSVASKFKAKQGLLWAAPIYPLSGCCRKRGERGKGEAVRCWQHPDLPYPNAEGWSSAIALAGVAQLVCWLQWQTEGY